jgi:hypothetical protein
VVSIEERRLVASLSFTVPTISRRLRRHGVLAAFGAIVLSGCAGQARRSPPPAMAAPLPRPTEPTLTDESTRREPVEALHETGPTLPLPVRDPDAETGSAFIARVRSLPRRAYDEAVYEAVASGNVPPFERQLVPVALDGIDDSGTRHTGRVWVLPDYLAIGSNEDFILVPMTPRTAQRIANLTECLLPTRKLVDAIYCSATCQLRPRTIEGGPRPSLDDHTDYATHKAMLDEQRRQERSVLGALTAGQKKDIVVSNRLLARPRRVAIYGWHRSVDDPIQPLTTVHSRIYADYSHGVRLVHDRMIVDGDELATEVVLQDSTLSCVLSDEGPLGIVRYPLER